MKVLTAWLRSYLPELPVSDAQLAEDLTLRGIAVDGVFDLTPQHGSQAGSLFEMDITTNRVDAMNHYGIAREAATIYSLPLKPLELDLPAPAANSRASGSSSSPAPGPSAPPYPVRIEAPDLCGRFTARLLRNITIQPSSGPVAHHFRLLEQKQISNAVDATNYVTQAIGQPTHAFDLDKLQGGIVVRRARPGETLRTLDGVIRTLDPDDLVIADGERALSLAGVMGGWDSMITPATRNVLVEAAWFDPATIRRSSKRHGLHTDASHRFERGADFNAAPLASAMVSRILLESGGSLDGEFVDILQPEAERRTSRRPSIALALSEVRRILGPTDAPEGITAADIETILTGLGCTLNPALSFVAATATNPAKRHPERSEGPAVDPASPIHEPTQILRSAQDDSTSSLASDQNHGYYAVVLPSWRLDLEREIDLIEEVARVYGYNRFQNTLPPFTGTVHQLPHAAAEGATRSTLLACGLSEAISSTFCSVTDAVTFAPQPNSAAAIENPLSEEAGMLRPSLLPGMLTMLAGNLHRDVEDIALFELGTVFTASGSAASGTANDKVSERPSLALGLAGSLGSRAADFYTLKGIVEQLAARFAARSHYYDRFPSDSGLMPAYLHPGRSARLVVDGSTIGYFGQLHPDEAARRKLRAPIYLGELRIDRLYAQGLRHPVPRELSRFQAVRRDFSFLLPETVTYAEVDQAVRALNLAELTSFAPQEILRAGQHPQVPAGQLSLLLRTTFQSHEHTLKDEELHAYAEQVVAAVERIGGRLRG